MYEESMRLGRNAAWELDWERAAGCYTKALAGMPGGVEAMNALGLAMHAPHLQLQFLGLGQAYDRSK